MAVGFIMFLYITKCNFNLTQASRDLGPLVLHPTQMHIKLIHLTCIDVPIGTISHKFNGWHIFSHRCHFLSLF